MDEEQGKQSPVHGPEHKGSKSEPKGRPGLFVAALFTIAREENTQPLERA